MMSTLQDPQGLDILLREATRDLHARAERSGFVAELLRGRGSREGYLLLLRNLLPAYEELERGLGQHLSSPILGGLPWSSVFRASALERDLQILAGTAWRSSLAVLPEGEDYASRVARAAGGNGERLLAHAYTRYLGDLSGGQILAKLLARSLGLAAHELSFYSFPAIVDPARFKSDFRRSLAVAGRWVDRAAVVDEAVAAFSLNIALSEAVQVRA
jgi:heme oxygenase